ncbi:hypothetical protein SAMN04488540_11484 [Ferrimonas sediminum]|uniref:Lipoprotein n=1 Tax=Ferrimonas sediminum TaxID=718193 RepID=A0A1G8X4B6_9GAMM|nr:hypothetical protein [Ferrimonas sediminum]SDJ85468.1 hypothetical protein SAMN04488540_11484 [Ferrimonas sediminum]
MVNLGRVGAIIALLIGLGGCTSGLHGSFASHSYGAQPGAVLLGPVQGLSCQTQVLYFIPMDDAPSTQQAIEAAKAQLDHTDYLADLAIDDETLWHIGYARQCIVVRAFAYGRPAAH